MTVIVCNECGAPWGSISGARDEAAGELWAALDVYANDPDRPRRYKANCIIERAVVRVSAVAAWSLGKVGAEVVVPGCWQDVAACDLPKWWTRKRERLSWRAVCHCENGWEDR